jgi:hypothetical protein
MRLTAFKSILAAVVVTTGALSTHIAKAETALKVPFSFTLSGQSMPAGVYAIQEDTFHNVVILRDKTSNRSFAYALRPGDASTNEVHVALKFEISGNTHVLRGIQFGSRTTSRLDNGPAPYDAARLSQGR